MYCKDCGCKLKKGEKYCPDCGTEVTEIEYNGGFYGLVNGGENKKIPDAKPTEVVMPVNNYSRNSAPGEEEALKKENQRLNNKLNRQKQENKKIKRKFTVLTGILVILLAFSCGSCAKSKYDFQKKLDIEKEKIKTESKGWEKKNKELEEKNKELESENEEFKNQSETIQEESSTEISNCIGGINESIEDRSWTRSDKSESVAGNPSFKKETSSVNEGETTKEYPSSETIKATESSKEMESEAITRRNEVQGTQLN